MSEYAIQPFGPESVQGAQALSLSLPTISLSQTLTTRLIRHDKSLIIDDEALLQGVRILELERPVSAQIDTLPKDIRKTDPKVIEYSDNGFNRPYGFTMAVNPDPETFSAAVDRRVNTAFWTGVLVANRLAETKTDRPGSSDIGRITRRSWIGYGAIVIPSNIAATTIERGEMGDANSAWNLGIAIAIAIPAAIARSMYISRKVGAKPDSHKLERRVAKQADALAYDHRVLTYGFFDSSDLS